LGCVLSGKGWDRLEYLPPVIARLVGKDLGIVMSVAREAGAVIPVGSVVTQLMGALVAQGGGGSTTGAVAAGGAVVRPRPGGEEW
jgi:3-hydroxyisobutyrate dehydrogenase-like beta-hydroxyacid dehydrogenase